MEWVILFLAIGGLISSFIFQKKNPMVLLFFAVALALFICIVLNQSGTSGGSYEHYVNGRRVSSDSVSMLQTIVLFIIFSCSFFGIFMGLGALYHSGKKNNASLFQELTGMPQGSNVPTRVSNALVFAIIFWPIGFGLFNMVCLGRGRIWILRLLLITVVDFSVSIIYRHMYGGTIFLKVLIISALLFWVYDVVDTAILNKRINSAK